jgi:hypothetical protein
VELTVDVHKGVTVVVRGDEKDVGNVIRREGDHHPERPGEVCDTNLGEQVIA